MTTRTLTDPQLQAFSDFLAQRIGLHFPPARWSDMLRGLARAAPAFGFQAPEPCMHWLISSTLNRQQVEILARQLSVGETYFFREPGVFAALENDILPPLIAARRAAGRSLRLWSAGCCTGEEPYSLAILLTRLIPDYADWNISILGTDINPDFLAKARRGVYSEWSFRAAPTWLKTQCFETPAPGSHALAARFKRMVKFDYLNLAEDAYPSVINSTNGIDIILCRNVLMYFETSNAAAVARKLHCSLVDGGRLIVSPSEASATIFSQFTLQPVPDAVVYCKTEHPTTPPAASPWSEPLAVDAWVEPPATSLVSRAEWPTATPEPARLAFTTPFQAALLAYAAGEYERVAALLAERAGGDARALALLARASANQGRLSDASRWCDAAVAADKVDPGLRYLLASVLDEQGLTAPAVAALKQALYLDQNFILAHYALGNLYRRLDKPNLARRHFAHARQLLSQLPSNAALPDAEGLSAGRLAEIIDATESLL